MYCIECGAIIPENSKFCSHCGKKQIEGEPTEKEKLADAIIENAIVNHVIETHKKYIDYQFLRKMLGWYLAWVMLHLTILLTASEEIFTSGNGFWPFDGLKPCKYCDFAEYYDITEFLLYSILPIAILFIISLIKGQQINEKTEK